MCTAAVEEDEIHTGHLVRAVSRQAEALRPIPPEGMHHSYVVTTTHEQHPQGAPKAADTTTRSPTGPHACQN